MPKEFEPWFAVKVGARKNRKIVALPNDTARLGWFLGVLAEAKLQRPAGRFDSREQLIESVGRYGEHVDDYLRQGLLEVAPRLCEACKRALGTVPPGCVVVHDWQVHQRDPGRANRAAEWRANADRTLDERAENAPQTPDERGINADRTPDVTADSRGDGRAAARGGARRRETQDNRQENESVPNNGVYPAASAVGPLLNQRELTAWQPYRRAQWETFKAAWWARGFKLPPQGDPDDPRSQAHIVWEILDARGDELATWVTDAPGKTSHAVVAHLLERWQAIKADAGIEDEAPPDVERDPTSTPESAGAILRRIREEVPDWARPADGAS
jgi:hypothetical protein